MDAAGNVDGDDGDAAAIDRLDGFFDGAVNGIVGTGAEQTIDDEVAATQTVGAASPSRVVVKEDRNVLSLGDAHLHGGVWPELMLLGGD